MQVAVAQEAKDLEKFLEDLKALELARFFTACGRSSTMALRDSNEAAQAGIRGLDSF